MNRAKRTWKQLPDKPRRVLTFAVGALLILTSALIGWIPGPGGMIPFLLGIAILSTEFEWAERFRDRVLTEIKSASDFMKQHPVIGLVSVIGAILGIALFTYVLYTYII